MSRSFVTRTKYREGYSRRMATPARMSAPASDPESTVAVVVEGTPTDTARVAASEPTADETSSDDPETAPTTILPGSGGGPVGGMIQTPPPGPVE